MKATLTTNYIYLERFRGFKSDYPKYLEFKKWIEENKGKTVEIDIEFLFDNQYNTKDGYRIYDTWINRIENDIRTDENIFFVKHPNGKDEVKNCNFNDHLKNKRFLSCYSLNGNYYRISRRSNIEFILASGEIYITNSIGYTALNKCRLSYNEKKLVRYCAERIINDKF